MDTKIDLDAARWWASLDGSEKRTAEKIAEDQPSWAERIIVAKNSTEALERYEARERQRVVEAEMAARADEQQWQTNLARAAELDRRAAEAAGLIPADQALAAAQVRVVAEDRDKKVDNLVRLLAGQGGGYPSIHRAWSHVTGRAVVDSAGLRDGWAEMIDDAGHAQAQESVVFPTTWAGVLGDAVTRRMIAEYAASPSTAAVQAVVSSSSFAVDFRSQRFERLGGYGTLPIVNQGVPYQPLTSPANDEASFTIAKRGGTEDYTLEAWLADDIQPLRSAIVKLTRAAAGTLARAIFDTFTTNPTLTYDGSALFVAGHSNTATTALSAAALGAARKAMRKQAALSDPADVIGAVPRSLFVAADLEDTAVALAVSVPMAAGVSGQAGATNMGVQRPPEWDQPGCGVPPALMPIVVPHWSSSTQWVLAADPTSVPIIAIGYLGTTANPAITIGNFSGGSMYSSDKVTLKIQHVWGFTVVDHRGLYRGNT